MILKLYALLVLLPALVTSYPSNIEYSIDPIEMHEVQGNGEILRQKRSGSGGFDIIGQLKQSVISQISKGSASLAGGSSNSVSSLSSGKSSGGSSSGSGHGSGHGSSYGPPHQEEQFNGWELKKSILNTIFQAVKAITGGVATINGQLIKGSGYLLSAGGKVVASTGDKVSNLGKQIATSAQLVPVPTSNNHFAGKFASLSSGLSSHSSSSSGTSESFTGYGPPTGGGHINYEPSGHTAPAIADTATTSHGTHYLPYQPPVTSNSYHQSLTSFGNEGPSNYIGSPLTASIQAPSLNDILASVRAIKETKQSAISGALRNIIQKVPNKYIDDQHDTYAHDQQNTYDSSQLHQYAIPSDPVPSFQSPKSVVPSIGTPPHIDSVTLGGGYGVLPAEHQTNDNPLNIYHTMTLKLANTNPHQSTPSIDYIGPPPSPLPMPTKYSTDTDHFVHKQQLHNLHNSLGPGFEIQKSLQYEFKVPGHLQYNRRSSPINNRIKRRFMRRY